MPFNMTAHEVPANSSQFSNPQSQVRRRDFLKIGAAAAVASTFGKAAVAATAKKLRPLEPGIKVSLQISTNATDEDLQFAQQLGVNYVNIPTGGAAATLENFINLKQRVEAAGAIF
jgi:phosphosulfolactate synthase (CoM biosynthesis protein A)